MGEVYPIAKKQQNQGIFFLKRAQIDRNTSRDISDFIPGWISKSGKTLTEKIEIPFNMNALCTTRPVYLIVLSRFLQTAPVTYAGNCHEVDSQKQFRSNVQSNYGGYTSKHIE
jgi:hypothetical protein